MEKPMKCAGLYSRTPPGKKGIVLQNSPKSSLWLGQSSSWKQKLNHEERISWSSVWSLFSGKHKVLTLERNQVCTHKLSPPTVQSIHRNPDAAQPAHTSSPGLMDFPEVTSVPSASDAQHAEMRGGRAHSGPLHSKARKSISISKRQI